MDWFGWQLPKDRAHKAPPFGPQALLQDLETRVPRYLDDVDQGKLIYPACKRARSDAGGDVSAIWNHTRLEAMRNGTVVPRREVEMVGRPEVPAADAVSGVAGIYPARQGDRVGRTLRSLDRSGNREAPRDTCEGIHRSSRRTRRGPRRTQGNHGRLRKRPRAARSGWLARRMAMS